MNIITGHWWEKALSDMYCYNHVHERSVNTQGGCQALCEAKSDLECVGITYSHKVGSTDYCYLCVDDTTEYSTNEYTFYRKLGILEILIP